MGAEEGIWQQHTFPDKEISIRILSDIKNKPVIIFDSLHNPNAKMIPLIFLAETAKALGASQVGLVAPYLSYMRQDIAFNAGEGVSAKHFSKLISSYFDWMITIEPHLHRIHHLSEVYTIPALSIHAGSVLSDWINHHVDSPILIGPDSESEQWVSSVSEKCHFPYVVLNKIRTGDKSVSISIDSISGDKNHTPVLVDDIISSGRTMVEVVRQLNEKGTKLPVCLGVHGLFSDDCMSTFDKVKYKDIITCNTIEHPSNAIDVDCLLKESSEKMIKEVG